MDGAVTGQITHVGVDVRQLDGADKLQVDVLNGDPVQRRISRDHPSAELQISEEIT